LSAYIVRATWHAREAEPFRFARVESTRPVGYRLFEDLFGGVLFLLLADDTGVVSKTEFPQYHFVSVFPGRPVLFFGAKRGAFDEASVHFELPSNAWCLSRRLGGLCAPRSEIVHDAIMVYFEEDRRTRATLPEPPGGKPLPGEAAPNTDRKTCIFMQRLAYP
jgi:hypothetical protein